MRVRRITVSYIALFVAFDSTVNVAGPGNRTLSSTEVGRWLSDTVPYVRSAQRTTAGLLVFVDLLFSCVSGNSSRWTEWWWSTWWRRATSWDTITWHIITWPSTTAVRVRCRTVRVDTAVDVCPDLTTSTVSVHRPLLDHSARSVRQLYVIPIRFVRSV